MMRDLRQEFWCVCGSSGVDLGANFAPLMWPGRVLYRISQCMQDILAAGTTPSQNYPFNRMNVLGYQKYSTKGDMTQNSSLQKLLLMQQRIPQRSHPDLRCRGQTVVCAFQPLSIVAVKVPEGQRPIPAMDDGDFTMLQQRIGNAIAPAS